MGRSWGDAPEIDGAVYLEDVSRKDGSELQPGDLVKARIVEADEYDLWGDLAE